MVFSTGLILFGLWYILYFNSGKLHKTATGIPANYGVKEFNSVTDTGRPDFSFKIELKDVPEVFVVRMYGEDFNIKLLQENLSSKKSVEIIYHPMKNEHGEFEVYRITQEGKEIYTFNKKFSTNSSRSFGWIMLTAGTVFFLLGIYSVIRRLKNV